MSIQITTAFVVLLTDLLLHGDWVHEGTTLEVERAIRNDWKGSGMCRDATDEEIAEYRAEAGEEGGDDDRSTAADLAAAQAQLKALEAERETLQGQVDTLTGERDALRTELEALKAKGAKGSKPAPAGE